MTCWIAGDALYWRANTEKGEALTAKLPMMEDSGEEAVAAQQEATREILKKLPLANLDLSKVGAGKTKELFSRPEWKQLSEACLGCGTCTFVCPTCQCYDIQEFTGGKTVRRFRCWDSCMYSDFTKMSAGQPRPTQLERFRQRFMHKLVYFPDNNDGCFGCVGCGRCLAEVPDPYEHRQGRQNVGRCRSMRHDPLIPAVCVVTKIRVDTPDVKTFRVVGLDGKKPFEHIPGQCAMLSIPGVGEALFSITSSPTEPDFVEFSIKKCGCVTQWLHGMEEGQQITVRGPYGNGFPVDTDFAGKDLLFIAGGIGLAPLHSVINYCRHYRDRYGSIDIVYGSRSKEDLVDFQEILDVWCKEDGINVHLTIDREQPDWDGHVGFVPNYVKELGFDTSKTVVMCGPPIMIKFTLGGLMELGFDRTHIYTTMELKMKCALGKCGRCNIGNKYVCKDGPVFRFDQLDELPDEY